MFKADSLEGTVFYLAYCKGILKGLSFHIQRALDKGILDEAEMVLIESILIGMTRLDGEFEQAVEHCLARTEKAEHILLALNRVLKQETENEN